MNVAVPHADAVDGDLLEAAKPLLLLGWSAPACLTARVALERTLLDLVDAAKLSKRVPQRPSFGDLAELLWARRIRVDDHSRRNTRLYSKLGNVAHGGDVSLFEAVSLIETAGGVIADWHDVKSRL